MNPQPDMTTCTATALLPDAPTVSDFRFHKTSTVEHEMSSSCPSSDPGLGTYTLLRKVFRTYHNNKLQELGTLIRCCVATTMTKTRQRRILRAHAAVEVNAIRRMANCWGLDVVTCSPTEA